MAFDWFSTLFAGFLPYDSVFRVFDAFLSEGRTILLRVGLAILDGASSMILECNSNSELTNLLNTISCHFSEHDPLMKVSKNLFNKFSYLIIISSKSEHIDFS